MKYVGIGYWEMMGKWWEMYNDGEEGVKWNGNRVRLEVGVNVGDMWGLEGNVMGEVIGW